MVDIFPTSDWLENASPLEGICRPYGPSKSLTLVVYKYAGPTVLPESTVNGFYKYAGPDGPGHNSSRRRFANKGFAKIQTNYFDEGVCFITNFSIGNIAGSPLC